MELIGQTATPMLTDKVQVLLTPDELTASVASGAQVQVTITFQDVAMLLHAVCLASGMGTIRSFDAVD